MNWFETKDRLPDSYVAVVVSDDNDNLAIAVFCSEGRFVLDYDHSSLPFVPTKWRNVAAVEDLVGLTLTRAENIEGQELVFETTDGRVFKFHHDQDCCESVGIESIVGDLSDLVGEPLLRSEVVSSDGVPGLSEYDESFTWTFYKFATRKGYVDVRWYGTSNGYYSEAVDFTEVLPDRQGSYEK